MADTVKLFVYGTLRRPAGGPAADTYNHEHIAGSVVSAHPAILQDAVLHDFRTYPGIAPGKGPVIGEVLELLEDALAETDRIEGHPERYMRRLESVQLASGESIDAWVYWAPPGQTTQAPVIESGDWFDRTRTSSEVLELPDDPDLRAVLTRVADEPCSWLSTVRPDQRPHSVPMWHVLHGNRIYLVTPNTSQKLANVRSNPNVVLTLPDPLDVVTVDGWAVEMPAALEDLRSLFVSKYEWDPGNEPAGMYQVLEITPRRVRRANGKDPSMNWRL